MILLWQKLVRKVTINENFIIIIKFESYIYAQIFKYSMNFCIKSKISKMWWPPLTLHDSYIMCAIHCYRLISLANCSGQKVTQWNNCKKRLCVKWPSLAGALWEIGMLFAKFTLQIVTGWGLMSHLNFYY